MRSLVRQAERWAGPVISVVSLAAVGWWITQQEAPDFSREAINYGNLLIAFGVVAGNTMLRGWRWHVILRHAGVHDRFSDALGLTTVGYMGNNVLPARGGELLKVMLMSRQSKSRYSEVLGTVIAERLLDAAMLVMLFAALTWANVGGGPGGSTRATVAAGLLALGAIALAVYLALRRRGRFDTFASKMRPFARSSKLLLGPIGVFLSTMSLTIWACEGLVFLLIGDALGVDLAYLDALMVIVLASFFSMIPAAPGYVGTFDAGIVLGLRALDISGSVAVTLVLVARLVLFVPVTIAGLVLMFARYGGFGVWRGRTKQLTV